MTRHTMRDVARLAGVSVATVSAVINGTAIVSEGRTQRVREAMEALDYYPDQVARSLKVGRTDVIGMVVPDITHIFFPVVIRGVEDAARVHGYSVRFRGGPRGGTTSSEYSVLAARGRCADRLFGPFHRLRPPHAAQVSDRFLRPYSTGAHPQRRFHRQRRGGLSRHQPSH